ncbi:carnitine transporter [Marasmius tenuissimus]|nr:carnitine transporter [Marasmius tenuissimus]
MSSTYTSSPSSSGKKYAKRKPAARRAPSASEIARNVKNFETWSTHQNLEQAEFSDLPLDLVEDVKSVFSTTARIPLSWVEEDSADYEWITSRASPEFLSFLSNAYKGDPDLFFDDKEKETDVFKLFLSLGRVFSVWERLMLMIDSSEKWSEADYVANVYAPLRSPAITESTQRVQPRLSLPQPPISKRLGTEAARVLRTKIVIPDCAVLIPASSIQHLSSSTSSPYHKLKRADKSANGSSTFCFQTTICDSLPDRPSFQVASSFWEDKKPVHHSLEDAYRQNRMSSAVALRQLHFLHVQAPVIGLVWCQGIVRAHVDWHNSADSDEPPTILSAPYAKSDRAERNGKGFEWRLERPQDLLQVHFLIRNIDRWTTTRFRERVEEGIGKLVDHVVTKKAPFQAWRRCGEISSKNHKENLQVASHGSDSTSKKPTLRSKTTKSTAPRK